MSVTMSLADANTAPKECFSVIQTKRLSTSTTVANSSSGSTSNMMSLCPSMDICTFGTDLYRTVNWQTLGRQPQEQAHPTAAGNMKATVAAVSAWHPQGQVVATVMQQQRQLPTGNDASDGDTETSKAMIQVSKVHGILTGDTQDSYVLPPPPLPPSSDASAAAASGGTASNSLRVLPVDLCWQQQQRFCTHTDSSRLHVMYRDLQWKRPSSFPIRIPSESAYTEPGFPDNNNSSTAEEPFSVLVSLGKKKRSRNDDASSSPSSSVLQAYGQGRFPLWECDLPDTGHMKNDHSHRLAVSLNLGHVLVLQEQVASTTNLTFPPPPRLTITHIPRMAANTSLLTLMTRHYTTWQAHLLKFQQTCESLPQQWQSSLAPLDRKFSKLETLLQTYGLISKKTIEEIITEETNVDDNHDDSIRTHLGRYMLLGRQAGNIELLKDAGSSGGGGGNNNNKSNDLQNVLDQYFTSAQTWHDQLIQKMQRSLTVGLAHVESTCQAHLVAPSQVLVQTARALLAQQHQRRLTASSSSSSSDSYYLLLVNLLKATQDLHVQVQELRDDLIRARQVLEDVVTWLRSEAAAHRARGTAPHSVQREHYRQRKASDLTTTRVYQYLQAVAPTEQQESTVSNNFDNINSTENIWQLGVARYFKPDVLPHALQQVRQLSQQVFAAHQTRGCIDKNIDGSIQTETIVFPSVASRSDGHDDMKKNESTAPVVTALHVRRGASPGHGKPWQNQSRQYVVVAQGLQHTMELYVLPLDCQEPVIPDEDCDDDTDDSDCEHSEPPGDVYACRLIWPSECQLVAVEFYGRDTNGKIGEEEEERQSLCVLTKNIHTSAVQLWRTEYDSAPLEATTGMMAVSGVNRSNRKENVPSWTLPNPSSSVLVQAVSSGNEDDESQTGDSVICARTRTVMKNAVALVENDDSNKPERSLMMELKVSGSRGVAAISCRQGGDTAILELFDLEDDEEDDEEDDMEE